MYGGVSWFLLLLERVEYNCAALIRKLHDLGGGKDPLIAKDILEILGVCGVGLLIRREEIDGCEMMLGFRQVQAARKHNTLRPVFCILYELDDE